MSASVKTIPEGIKRGGTMENPKKILHIDPDFMITYFIVLPGVSFKSSLSIPCAIQLLKNEVLDLVLSEPHHMAILVPQN